MSADFLESGVGYVYEVDARDFVGWRPGDGWPRTCHPGPMIGKASDSGIGETVNDRGWMQFKMHTAEDGGKKHYLSERGRCKCRLVLNNVFSVSRWMRNILIDYHGGTRRCVEEGLCPISKLGSSWE